MLCGELLIEMRSTTAVTTPGSGSRSVSGSGSVFVSGSRNGFGNGSHISAAPGAVGAYERSEKNALLLHSTSQPQIHSQTQPQSPTNSTEREHSRDGQSNGNSNTNANGTTGNTITSIPIKSNAPDLRRRQLMFDAMVRLHTNSRIVIELSGADAAAAAGLNATMNATVATARRNVSRVVEEEVNQNKQMRSKGTLIYAWGAGYHGQLGLNTYRKKCRKVPAMVDFHYPILMVACGGFHTALLTDDGKIFTWGDGREGQLGNLARKHNMLSTPQIVDSLLQYKIPMSFVACGQAHTAAVASNGSLFTWGDGKWGQLGHGVRLDQRFPKRVDLELNVEGSERNPGPFSRPSSSATSIAKAKKIRFGLVTHVKCGERHTMILNSEGHIATFGSGQHGQLGHGNYNDQLRPLLVNSEALNKVKIKFIDCGSTMSAVITEAGQLFIWGFGESIYPSGEPNIIYEPRHLPMKEKLIQVACGLSHVLLLTDTGDVYSFGSGTMGQLGHGTTSNVRNPRLILRGKEIQQVAAGRYHSMALSTYGMLWSWGCGESGQLGHDTLDTELFPRIVLPILPNVLGQVACGEHHTFCLSSIAYEGISTDVRNWCLIENEELKLKRAMLRDTPNGLKSKHIKQLEQERQIIIANLADQLRTEKKQHDRDATDRMRTITDPEELWLDMQSHDSPAPEGVRLSNNGVLLLPNVDDDVKHKSAKKRVSAVPLESASPLVRSITRNSEIRRDLSEATNNEENLTGGAKRLHSRFESFGNSRQLAPAVSAPTLPVFDSKENHLLSDTSSTPAVRSLEKSASAFAFPAADANERAEASSSAVLAVSTNASMSNRAPILTSIRVKPTSRSQSAGHGNAIRRRTARDTALSSRAMVFGYHPLVPRIGFMEQATQSLERVKSSVIEHSAVVNANVLSAAVIKLKNEYNRYQAKTEKRRRLIKELQQNLALTTPSQGQSQETIDMANRIKQLNMKLVTLTTRIGEADQNKRNYELYIIRMKEEDLTLSRQMEAMRASHAEVDRILAKLNKMWEKLSHQKQEMTDEMLAFTHDIQEFLSTSENVVGNYRSVLKSNAQVLKRHKIEIESHLLAKQAERANKEASTSGVDSRPPTDELSAGISFDNWNDKLDYYEQRFMKLQSATGLSKPDEIIAKFIWNEDVSAQLKREAEKHEQALLKLHATYDELKSQKHDLQHNISMQLDGNSGLSPADRERTWQEVRKHEEQLSEATIQLANKQSVTKRAMQRLAVLFEAIAAQTRIVNAVLAGSDIATANCLPSKQQSINSSNLISNSLPSNEVSDTSPRLSNSYVPIDQEALHTVTNNFIHSIARLLRDIEHFREHNEKIKGHTETKAEN